MKNTVFDGFQTYFAGCIYINNSLSKLIVDSILFIRCNSIGRKFYIDTDYGCPAYFHYGNSIFCRKLVAENCMSEKRCVAASFVDSRSNLPMQTNMSSFENCRINYQLIYMHNNGNVIFSDINCSFNFAEEIEPGVHAGYDCYQSFHEFCIFYYCISRKGLSPSTTNGKCRNLIVHSLVSSEMLIYNYPSVALSIENSCFYNNSLTNVFGEVNLKDCFYDRELDVSSAINCKKKFSDPLTSLPKIDILAIHCVCSAIKMNRAILDSNLFLLILIINNS